MIREIVRPKSQDYTIRIPKEYINQEVEILVLPFSQIEENDDFVDLARKTSGILKDKNIDPIKWQKEIRDEWER